MKQPLTSTPGVPDAFVNKFGRHVTGFLCGFDRLRFHASLRMPAGLDANELARAATRIPMPRASRSFSA
jgi:hypothetical protein